MITWSAVTVRLSPSSRSTSIVLASLKVPQPWISSILFFFIKKCTPLTMESDTSRLRACVGLKSIVASPVIPNLSFSCSRMCASSALRSSALDGMQPTLRHTPPQYCFSITPTFRPSCEARMAATYPPGPAPRTTTSKSLTERAYSPRPAGGQRVRAFPDACNGGAMRFLIAGSSGFLGTRLTERLAVLGHDVTRLVRRPPGSGEVRWDPYTAPLGHEVVDDHDVVVNLAGSPTVGNPHSKKWASNLKDSRVTTTRVLAEAIAQSSSKPVFLAGNAVAIYGDHADERITEETHPRSDTLLAGVTRAWQAAAQSARHAGARVCILRTSPVYDRRSQPLGALRLQFKGGAGGRLGDGHQYVPLISARDWVDAVIHLAETDSASGPFNLCCERVPTNAELTKELARQLHRPAFAHVPAPVLRKAAGEMAHELLNSVNSYPQALLDSGFTFHDPDIAAVLREGLNTSR